MDDEPSFNETIRQKARKCRRRKLKYSVLSSEMFFTFIELFHVSPKVINPSSKILCKTNDLT